jgi:hypothetical protein
VNEVPKSVLLQFMDAMFIFYVPSEFRTSVPSIFRTATTGHWRLPRLSASPYSSVCKVSFGVIYDLRHISPVLPARLRSISE